MEERESSGEDKESEKMCVVIVRTEKIKIKMERV